MAFEETRFVHTQLMLDTNVINARQSDPDLNQLECWRANEVVLVIMSSHSSGEARAGGNAARGAKAVSYVYSYIGDSNEEERARKQAIAEVLFTNGGRTDAERNDVDICFHAYKYEAILVTNDGASKRQPGGILGNREALAKLGVTVMRPSEVVGFVRQRIAARDERSRQIAELQGTPLPAWVGAD